MPTASQEIDIREFDNTTLQLQQKLSISEWQNSLIDQPGTTATMVNALEIIIKFSNDITKEKGIEVPP